MLRCAESVKLNRALEQVRRRVIPRLAPVHWWLLIPPRKLWRLAANVRRIPGLIEAGVVKTGRPEQSLQLGTLSGWLADLERENEV